MAREGRMSELQNLATFLMARGSETGSPGRASRWTAPNSLATGGNFYKLSRLHRRRLAARSATRFATQARERQGAAVNTHGRQRLQRISPANASTTDS